MGPTTEGHTQTMVNNESTHNHILLIEDNPGDARLVEILLLESDLIKCKFTNKTSLSEGMDLLENGQQFAAILLDLTLPDSQGFGTLERLLDRFPENNVIVLTGLSDKSLGVKSVQRGAQDFLVKGAFDADQLSKTLKYSIERSNVLKRLEESQRIAHIGNWEYNPNLKVFTASDEVYRILGFERNGRNIVSSQLEDPTSPVFFFSELHQNTLKEKIVKKDLAITKNDGSKGYVFIQCKVSRNIKGEVVLHGIIQDITERRKAEELQKERDVARKSAMMKEQFIASISHEMRTPMNAILGMSNLLVQNPNGDRANGICQVH